MLFYFPEMFHHQPVGRPFIPAYTAGQPHATFVLPNGRDAGIKENDILLAINGRAFTGTAVFGEAIGHDSAGDIMHVTVRTASEPAARNVNVTIQPHRLYTSSANLVLVVTLKLVLPIFCILLGFWVAAVRPRDPSTWLLVPVLLFLSTIDYAGLESWGPRIRDLATIYRFSIASAWPLFMFLFGLYFPERSPEREDPRWWRWTVAIYIPTMIAVTLLTIIENVGEIENFAAVARLAAFFERGGPLIFGLTFIGVGSLFASMKIKSAMAASQDAKRRFNLVYAGATAAVTPLFILTVIQSFKGLPQEQIFPE
jgi:sigma-B regulation protein RsbU (phosphoserine phosphatase)